jgi:cytochrome P450
VLRSPLVANEDRIIMRVHTRQRANVPPGPRGDFLFGNTFAYTRDPIGFLSRAARQYGDIVRLRLGNLTTYLLVNPEHIDYVLHSHADSFMKDRLTRWLIPLVGQGLLTSEGEFWRRQRRLAQPAFPRQQIERYATVMVDHTERMLATWQDGQVRDIHQDMMRQTLGIVAKTLLGADLGGEAARVGESLEIVMNYFMSPMRWFGIRESVPLPSTQRYRRAIQQIDDLVYGIIRQRRASGEDPGDLLSRLLAARDEHGNGMTDPQLRDEAVTLVLAGHETTALVLFYTFCLLARSPEAEQRLSSELRDVLAGRAPTAGDVPNLRYTEWVIREAMRLYPPAWAIAREALVDCEIGNYHVPKGTQMYLPQWLVHRDGRWFEDPESFRPERWDNDLIKRLPRCAYFPFGGGPRICIGNHFAMMEAVLILATIAGRYRLSMQAGQSLELLPSVTLRPRHAVGMRLHARDHAGVPTAGAAVETAIHTRSNASPGWADSHQPGPQAPGIQR